MAKDKDKPKDEARGSGSDPSLRNQSSGSQPKVQTPIEYLRSKLDHEYVRHQPQHKKEKK